MGAQGTAILDFGAFPGASDAAVVITGQVGIIAGSLVEAWIRPVDSTDHSADEHLVETIELVAGAIVAGTGFTVYGRNTNQVNEPDAARSLVSTMREPRIYGKWNANWVWN